MQFRKDDLVRFLNEQGGGKVVRQLGNGMVLIEVEDGFEYPYPANQLVPVEPITGPVKKPVSQQERAEEYVSQTSATVVNTRFPDGIYLAFIPQNQTFPAAGKIAFELFNHSDYDIYYSLSLKDGSLWSCIQSGTIGPRRRAEVDVLTPQDLDNWGQIKTDVLFFSDEHYEHRSPASDILRFKGVKFFKDSTFTDHLLIGKKAWVAEVVALELEEQQTPSHILTNDDLKRMMQEKNAKTTSSKSSIPHLKNQKLEKEVDLHIEELMNNWQGMTNAQLLDVQLHHMQRELDAAIGAHLQRIIFIHGVGNGRLKSEVRRILSTYKGIRVHDGSYQRYGFGATEVEII
jgi:hypothetical protein